MVVSFAKLTTKKQVVLTSKIDQLLTMIGIIGCEDNIVIKKAWD